MTSSRFAAALSATILAWPAIALAQPDRPTHWYDPLPTTDNAALVYWQAVAVTPALTDQQKQVIWDRSAISPDLEVCKEILSRLDPAAQLLRRAARLPRCEWGINWNESPFVFFPVYSKLRDLAYAVRFRVLMESRSGRLDQCLEDGLALCVFTRQIGRNEPLSMVLFANSMEGQAIEALAETVPQFNRIQLFRLSRDFAALPPHTPILETLALEKRGPLGWYARAIQDGQLEAALAVLEKGWGDDRQSFETLASEARKDAQSILTRLDEAAVDFDGGIRLHALPFDDFHQAAANARAQVLERSHRLSSVLQNLPEQSYLSALRVAARGAMLQAGIAFQRDGEDALEKHPDPTAGKPFVFRKTDTGFVLQSHHPLMGNGPLVVMFGRPKAS